MNKVEVEKRARRGAALPLVTIVGRPNVGKSTLFNRLVGERRSIVGDEPGITRDRIYGEAEWSGHRFSVVDTGGIVPDDDALIPSNILKQAEAAIGQAVALVWVVDVRAGITSLDEELARLLRGTGKTVIVAANKADAARLDAEAGEFHRFGFDEVVPVSAEHGDGVGDLLDALIEKIWAGEKVSAEDVATDEESSREPWELRLAIVGRPNVGKSSLVNRLLGEERVIVSPVAGTTRDAIDTLLEWRDDGAAYDESHEIADPRAQTSPGGALSAALESAQQSSDDNPQSAIRNPQSLTHRFRLIDTAGIRRKGKTEEMAEKLSVVMARRSLERADVAVVIVDATEGVVALDANIAGYAVDAGCSVIIAVNKWDAVPGKETGTPYEFERELRDKMKFLDWAPVVFISALTGQRVQNILPLALRANRARNLRIPTSQLNQFFERAVDAPGAPTAVAKVKGGQSRLRIQYVTQIGVRPPRFVVFTAGGRPGLHFSYERYLLNRLREEFDFYGTPIRLIERHRSERKK
ncbi:MAG: ribosome biogenesis GTPase Der [Acidobacteria bacterium]|nr:ribosome biogenesis GTPase Der [Acidobacteriota bacterium]